MKSIVRPGKISGSIRVPGSKSYVQRAILSAALCEGRSLIRGITLCDDIIASIGVAHGLGAETKWMGDMLIIEGKKRAPMGQWYVGESGLTGRIASTLALQFTDPPVIQMAAALAKRPFSQLGQIESQLRKNGKFSPPTHIIVDGSLSSQFVSGLILLLSSVEFQGKLEVKHAKSLPYIHMTETLIRGEGKMHPADYRVEGDWSAAALLKAVSVMGGEMELKGLKEDSLQPDRAIIKLCKPGWENSAFDVDLSHAPDLFPAMAVIATKASGVSRFTGTTRLAHKETDRGLAIAEEFGKLGIRIQTSGDDMMVYPGKPAGGQVDSRGDHRMAMALAALGLGAEDEVIIDGAESVGKSYPDFWKDLQRMGANIELTDE